MSTTIGKPKIVLFNAPPRAGKDTAASIVADSLCYGDSGDPKHIGPIQNYHWDILKFADPLKAATHAMFGIDSLDDFTTARDRFEQCKETPSDIFGGLTPRQAYQQVSEKCVKPHFGHDFWGKVFVNRVKALEAEQAVKGNRLVALVPDSGFHDEAKHIIEYVGAANVLLVQITRNGAGFGTDTRSFIKLPGVKTMKLTNDGTLESFETKVTVKVREWIANG